MAYLTGSQLADYLNGTASNDVLYGFGGNDTLLGNAGTDVIYGGEGNDYVSGGSGGSDYLYGEGGDDFLVSWDVPSDRLSPQAVTGKWQNGGSGNDTLTSYGSAKTFMAGGSGVDSFRICGKGMQVTISDFQRGEKVTLLQEYGHRYQIGNLVESRYSTPGGGMGGTQFYDRANDVTIRIAGVMPADISSSVFKLG